VEIYISPCQAGKNTAVRPAETEPMFKTAGGDKRKRKPGLPKRGPQNRREQPMEKQNKKDILAAYKERKVLGGVYAIRNLENGKMLLLSATEISGSQNRFNFAQKTGSCIDLKLKDDWQKYGNEAFAFVVLEELEKKDTQTLKEFGEDIKILKGLWLEKLDSALLY
jgi:hypothetical protein